MSAVNAAIDAQRELQLPVRMGLGDFLAHDLGLRQFIAGPPFLADVEVVESVAVAGVPQLTAPLADRDPRPPRRRRGTRLPLLDPDRLNGRDPVVVLREPI